jgi:hypothetical protein
MIERGIAMLFGIEIKNGNHRVVINSRLVAFIIPFIIGGAEDLSRCQSQPRSNSKQLAHSLPLLYRIME